jgi:hypothetical protein
MTNQSEASNATPDPPRQSDWSRIALLWHCGMGAGLQFAKASVGFDALAAYRDQRDASGGGGRRRRPGGLPRMACVSLLPGAIYPMIPLLCVSPILQARACGAIAQLGNVGSVLGRRFSPRVSTLLGRSGSPRRRSLCRLWGWPWRASPVANSRRRRPRLRQGGSELALAGAACYAPDRGFKVLEAKRPWTKRKPTISEACP